ncbi:MAG: hypothetical protein K0S76_429 [Herbinix sp.]|jgi:DNA repair exonuclease SbcCD ATPase subunit|nr:hypothetical protein [Herbinix sp.]
MARKANIGATISLDGEKEYRQAISNVSKSMNVLKSDLKAVSAEYEGNANSMDALKAKNDILSRQQVEQEKRLALLRGALQDTTKQYGENSKQAQDWQIKLNNAYSELTKINRELDNNQKYMREAETSTDNTAKSIDEFGNKVKETKEETLKFGDVLKANLASEAIIQGVKTLFNAIQDGGRAMVDIVKETAAYADNMLTLSTQTGIATDTLQELNYMAELTDTSLETITSAMARNIRSMSSAQEGTKLYIDTYRGLGVQITDTNGQLRESQEVFWDTVTALGNIANETERDAKAMTLFGRSAQDLNPVIKLGKDGMAEFAQEARNMGAVLSGETLQKLGETDDALQRMYQQIEITKREFGTALAPAMTEAFGKIADKLGEVDDEFADFAGGALENTVDGFLWLVDNIDLVTSGLKGVAAALITKKAVDGITFAVQAYKTLTTATEVATAAQTAFNVASQANVIGVIASLVVGLGTALVTYADSSGDAAEATKKLSDETQNLLDNSKKLTEELSKKSKAYEEETQNIEAEYGALGILSDRLYDLADNEKKTNSEKQQMVSLVNQLNDAIPNLNLSLDEQTGTLSKQREEIDKLVSAHKDLALAKAAEKNLSDIAEQQIKSEVALNQLLEERTKKQEEFDKAMETHLKVLDLENKGYVWLSKSEKEYVNNNQSAKDATRRLSNEIMLMNDEITATEETLKSLDDQWNKTTKYIGDTSSIVSASEAFENVTRKYKEALEAQSENEIGTVEERIETINNLYEEQEDALEKRLKAEERVFAKSQETKLKAVETAQGKELDLLEANHKKKLGLIDEEYLEKMKTVDEDRYNALKSVQDQIDTINTQQEAEDRALKLKEEAEKKAELRARIENATTTEERMDAQQELADFEAEIARERLKAERTLQKDILDTQKKTINDEYDAKIKSLQAEQKQEEDKVSSDYENEKNSIEERYKLKVAALKEEQELERDTFKEKQKDNEEYLDKQKELAIKSAKETYEADLAELKLNNALKYDAVIENEEKIKEAMKQYAAEAGVTGLNEMFKNMNAADSKLLNVPKFGGNQYTGTAVDYDKMEDAIVNGLKKLNLSVVMDGKTVGKLIDGRIERLIQ